MVAHCLIVEGPEGLIVVDTGFALQPRSRLNSLSAVSNQAIAVMLRRERVRARRPVGVNA